MLDSVPSSHSGVYADQLRAPSKDFLGQGCEPKAEGKIRSQS